MANSKGLKKLVPDKDFIYGTGTIATFQKQILNFIDFIQQTPIPTIDTSNKDGDIDQGIIDQLNIINTNLKTHYTKIQTDAQTELTKVHDAGEVISKIYHFAKVGKVATKAIHAAVDVNNNADQSKMKLALNYMDKNLKELEDMLPSGYFDDIHQALNKDISNIDGDFQDMQNAIPADQGAKLDLTSLTEAEAKNQLDDQIDSLNSDIDTLQAEIAWETFGQVAIGITGGLIAIVNWWNPIGVVAAGATAVGEWQLAEDKASKQTQVSLDRTAISVSEAEEAILKPYYTTKQYSKKLKSMVTGLEKLTNGIGNLRSSLSEILDDMDAFVADLGDKDSLDFDYELVSGDFADLTTSLHNLMGAYQDSATSSDPKWVKMENQGQWEQILNDPNSPFYIKYVKEGV